MLISLNWLKDFVKIPKSLAPEELGLRLTMHTVEIDSVRKQADKFNHVIVGKILEVNKHPNADKLQLAKVDIKSEVLEIVCGAPNIKPGQLVPVALVGAVLPGGFEIKEAEIRGVRSCGMLCAEDELGLGSDHSGIMILGKKARVGQPLADYLRAADVIFEVDNKSITHRPDLWCHYGIAREISAFSGVKMINSTERLTIAALQSDSSEPGVRAQVRDFNLCPRYTAVKVENIAIAPSPAWMRERMIAVGVRPINNIVDITNYVMFELGQPLHAFDADLVDEIIVRQAAKNERIETIDGKKRDLDEDMLVIADSRKPVAVAGVMGGVESEIGDNTSSIIIEAANFNFISIRKTSAKLNLRTEASIRFEKALDPNLCEAALARAVELIGRICPGARVTGAPVDEKNFKLNQGPIELEIGWIKKFIGYEIKTKKIIDILTTLGFSTRHTGRKLFVTVPSWRATRDISAKEDLAEEVARIYGYDEIAPRMPFVAMAASAGTGERSFLRRVRNIMAGAPAMSEVYNYSFVGEGILKKTGFEPLSYIRLSNPISANYTMLRKGLAPNLLINVKTNQARFSEIKLFEIGSVYLPEMVGEEDIGDGMDGKLPYQEKRLGMVWAGEKKDELFGRLKGAVEYLAAELNLAVIFSATESVPAWADPAISAEIRIGDRVIGLLGGVGASATKSLGLKKGVAIAEISLKELYDCFRRYGGIKFRASDKFPPVTRDLAFVTGEKVLYNDIRGEILAFHEYISKAELFDVFAGEQLGKGKKSMAFHIFYRAEDRTLTAKEVDGLQSKLVKHLEDKFEAVIRDF